MSRRAFLAAVLASAALASCAGLEFPAHPLVGRVWDVGAKRFIPQEEAVARLAAADIALLGETHDNASHHRIQARILQRRIESGARPAVVMEQLDAEWQAAIDALPPGSSAEDLARVAQVSKNWNWPAFYAPLATLALQARLAIVAGNLSRARAREVVAKGPAAVLGSDAPARLAMDATWNDARQAALRRTLVAGHCGEDSPIIDAMVPTQRARDAVLADAMLAAGEGGVVAILGRGHARRDFGVPIYLAARAPARPVLSLGLVEVRPEALEPADYSEVCGAQHDLVWFTVRAERKDPCAAFKAMKKAPA